MSHVTGIDLEVTVDVLALDGVPPDVLARLLDPGTGPGSVRAFAAALERALGDRLDGLGAPPRGGGPFDEVAGRVSDALAGRVADALTARPEGAVTR